MGDFLGMKNILPPSDSKDAVLATDVGSGIKQAVVPVEVSLGQTSQCIAVVLLSA